MVYLSSKDVDELVGVAMRAATKQFALDGAIYRVNAVESLPTHTVITVSRLREKPRKRCSCGHRANVHAKRTTTIYHVPYQRKPLLIRLSKTRLKCSECGKTFDEDQPLISSISPHVSKACCSYIEHRLSEGIPVARIEAECGASKSIVSKVEATALHHKKYLPQHLCIDEIKICPRKTGIRRGSPHMAACIYDAEKRILTEMIKGDKPTQIRAYLMGFSKGERMQVKSVSCDLNKDYISLAKEFFPAACIYADKFHIAKLVGDGTDAIRKRIRNSFIVQGKQDTERAKRITRATKLYRKRYTELTFKQKQSLWFALSQDECRELRIGYLALQMFYEWSDSKYESREALEGALQSWVRVVK